MNMRIISAQQHGVIDYLVVLFLWVSSGALPFSNFVALLTLGLGGVHLTLTLITDFKFGLLKVLPFRIHRAIELIVSLALVSAPWILNFSDLQLDRSFYIGFGLAVFITWAITDYKSV
jgi:hypothetical protein